MAKAGKFALGAIVAGAAGYIAGILTAPKSGKETREDIKEAAVSGAREAERQLKRLHTELATLIDEFATKASSKKGAVKADVAKALERAKTVREKARVALSSVHEGETDDKDLQKAIAEANKAIEHLKKFATK